jgi:hypothetical protein
VQTITVGDVKDDDTKEKKRKHDKWKKKKNGGKAVKHAAHGDVAEIDTRLLSALLTVSSPSLTSCRIHRCVSYVHWHLIYILWV